MPRFLTLTDVSETLQISMAQARALVRSGDLPAIQIGGRGQWRVDQVKFDEFIDRLHQEQQDKARTRTSDRDSVPEDQTSGA